MMKSALTQQEIEKKLWDAATALRGSMDAGDYKNYVFPVLFWKWISDNWDLEREQAKQDLDLSVGSDGSLFSGLGIDTQDLEEAESDYHAFIVPDGCRWDQVVNNKNIPDEIANNSDHRLHPSQYLGVRVKHAMNEIAGANPQQLANIFGDASYSNKDRLPESALKNLLKPFNEITIDSESVPGDLMGGAYEYLLKSFADDSGKKAGEFFTPRSVVHLLTRLLKPVSGETIYDPTCGSGGMLIESVNAVREDGGDPRTLGLYGQEKNLTTQGIARMNLYIHKMPEHKIMRGDTLHEPKLWEDDELKKFDVVIANPPFSVKDWGNEAWSKDSRMIGDVPPNSFADFAFIQHMIASMKEKTGRIGVVMPHGVLFRSGAEKNVRKAILEKDLIEAVIGLPQNIFYGTGIPSCIIVMRSEKSEHRQNKILFIDASERFSKKGNMNEMRDNDINVILKAFHDEIDADGDGGLNFRLVDMDEIESNDFDLSIGRYVSTDHSVEVDVESAIASWMEAKEIRDKSEAAMMEILKGAGFIVNK